MTIKSWGLKKYSINIIKTMKFLKNHVYRLKDNSLVLSENSGDYYISDCYLLTEDYQIKTGYECPVPIQAEDIIENLGNLNEICDISN